MLFAQAIHAMGTNYKYDWLQLISAVLARFDVTPPARNTLTQANKQRDAEFAEKLFCSALSFLKYAKVDFAALGHRCSSSRLN